MFYEDLQDLLELTTKKDFLFIIGDWNAKVGSQEIPGVTGKFGLGVQYEAGQRVAEFCQENTLLPTTQETAFETLSHLTVGVQAQSVFSVRRIEFVKPR